MGHPVKYIGYVGKEDSLAVISNVDMSTTISKRVSFTVIPDNVALCVAITFLSDDQLGE